MGNSQEDKDLRRMVGERSGSNCRWNCHNHGDAPEQDVDLGAGKQEYDGEIKRMSGKNESDRRSQEIVPNTANSNVSLMKLSARPSFIVGENEHEDIS